VSQKRAEREQISRAGYSAGVLRLAKEVWNNAAINKESAASGQLNRLSDNSLTLQRNLATPVNVS
jgi:hypothetical protein